MAQPDLLGDGLSPRIAVRSFGDPFRELVTRATSVLACSREGNTHGVFHGIEQITRLLRALRSRDNSLSAAQRRDAERAVEVCREAVSELQAIASSLKDAAVKAKTGRQNLSGMKAKLVPGPIALGRRVELVS